jgi:hypothetical protein
VGHLNKGMSVVKKQHLAVHTGTRKGCSRPRNVKSIRGNLLTDAAMSRPAPIASGFYPRSRMQSSPNSRWKFGLVCKGWIWIFRIGLKYWGGYVKAVRGSYSRSYHNSCGQSSGREAKLLTQSLPAHCKTCGGLQPGVRLSPGICENILRGKYHFQINME